MEVGSCQDESRRGSYIRLVPAVVELGDRMVLVEAASALAVHRDQRQVVRCQRYMAMARVEEVQTHQVCPAVVVRPWVAYLPSLSGRSQQVREEQQEAVARMLEGQVVLRERYFAS